MTEHRRFKRVDRKLLVSYDHFNIDNIKDDEGVALTVDMSVRGLLLELPRPMDEGSTIRLSLNLEGDVVEAFGEIKRCAPSASDDDLFEVGVELKYISERFITVVENYFQAR